MPEKQRIFLRKNMKLLLYDIGYDTIAYGRQTMGKYKEKISDKSIWLTSTPTQTTLGLPFYVTEAGHFYAKTDYAVVREHHDSYLFMYTQAGCGEVQCDGTSVRLPAGGAVVIDCRVRHSYISYGGTWEFLWIHMKGSAVRTFFEMLYPNGVFTVNIVDPAEMTAKITELFNNVGRDDTLNAIRTSSVLHDIFNTLIADSLKNEREKGKGRYKEYAEHAVDLIHRQYSGTITIDDLVADIPLSKYHFIRVFKRVMGATPYNYLTNYRINIAKIHLRTTDMSVSEIADVCGFSDTSNFISQFKKHTGQKPLEYRRYFWQ